MRIAVLTTDNREPYRQYDRPLPWFGTAPEALLQGFAQLQGIEVHVLSCAQQRMVSSPEKLAPNIWFHSLPVPKLGWGRTLYQGCIRAIRKKLRQIQPDIVHGQGTERECGLSAIFSGFPNVLTLHGNIRLIARLENARPFSFWWIAAKLEAFTLPRTNGVVCITRYTQAAVADLARRTWLLPNAVDGCFFDVLPQFPGSGVPTILCVGQISGRKNQNAFIRSLDILAEEKQFRVLFLGGIWPESPYGRDFLELLRTRPWCEHIGFVSRDELREYLSRAALLVLPSLEDNCPMAVLEAAAAGVPVVAANVGGVPDLIEDGKTGFLCNPSDAESMRGAVEKALTNFAGIREIAAEAKRIARERFHPAVVAKKHLEIYTEVIAIWKAERDC